MFKLLFTLQASLQVISSHRTLPSFHQLFNHHTFIYLASFLFTTLSLKLQLRQTPPATTYHKDIMKCTTIAQILAYTAPVFSVPMPQLGGLLGSLPTISLPTSLPTSIPGLGSGTGTTTALPTSIAGLGSSTTGTSTSSGLTGLSGLTSAAGSSTENDVTSNTGCKALTVIFARGTSETGNMGTIIGPPLVTSLQTAVGTDQVAAQGVDYDASIAGNVQLGADGGPTMAALVKQALSQCPSTKVVLSGYSQGAMVVHNAAGSLTSGQFVGGESINPFAIL